MCVSLTEASQNFLQLEGKQSNTDESFIVIIIFFQSCDPDIFIALALTVILPLQL